MSWTRRDFLAGSAVAALAGAIGRPALARAWQAQTPAPPQTPAPAPAPVFTTLRRNVGWFTMRGGTIGYLLDPKAVVVVDSQYRDAAKVCLDGLRERAKTQPVEFLINTHHHADHTDGNVVFKGIAKKVVAQSKAAVDMHAPPGQPVPTTEQLHPDTTFADEWKATAGDERIHAKFYGRAHTSGDVVVTFERANVAHMGDLTFNQRHAIVDRAAGATIRGWMTAVDHAMKDHDKDTLYIFGHTGGPTMPVSGDRSVLVQFHDYLGAVLAFVEAQIKAGKSRDEVLAMRDPLKGFESFGRFPAANPRDPLTTAYDELTTK
jgi:glyoxylase-like metal-dependent hydrolase (beta-lactamase superfamily II)